MFRCVPFTLSILAIVYVQMICLGIGFLIPNYAQLVLHQNAFAAGCLLLPGCVVGAVVSPFSGRLLHRFGAKRPILEGNLAILFATACFGVFALRLSAAMFLVVYIFFAFGQSCSMGNSMTSGLRQLSVELNADGNAVINTTQQLGGAVGTSVVSSILAAAQAQLPGDMATGTMLGSHTAFLILAALAVAMLCCTACWGRFTTWESAARSDHSVCRRRAAAERPPVPDRKRAAGLSPAARLFAAVMEFMCCAQFYSKLWR